MPESNTTIHTRPIPSSGEQLPLVGIGTWQQFDVGPSTSGREPLRKVLETMLENGGTFIDSSPMYGNSEQVVGDLTGASAQADKFFYATKVWTSGQQAGIDQMLDSMRKMKRNTMDLMQIHNLVDWKTHLKTLRKWKEEGRVRYIGITHYTDSAHAQLEQIIRSEPIDFVQFNYSIRSRNAERSLLPAAREKGVAVIINEPFEKGALFNLVKGKSLPQWAFEYDIHTWGQFFLKFILSQEAVNIVIPGTSEPAHMADNMGAGLGRMPDEKGRGRMLAFIK